MTPDQLNTTVAITRLLAFNPFLFTISGILTSMQQMLGRFFFYAVAPLFYNGCIIISAIGVLNVVTTTQSATITELAKTDPYIPFWQLFLQGFTIGKEHILSLVNTLVLAYAGASIGIIIYIIVTVQSNIQPFWTMMNSEVLAEELVRTLIGSIGLILAVPITTLLAAFFAKYSVKIK